jgi:hypothetical protein
MSWAIAVGAIGSGQPKLEQDGEYDGDQADSHQDDRRAILGRRAKQLPHARRRRHRGRPQRGRWRAWLADLASLGQCSRRWLAGLGQWTGHGLAGLGHWCGRWLVGVG